MTCALMGDRAIEEEVVGGGVGGTKRRVCEEWE